MSKDLESIRAARRQYGHPVMDEAGYSAFIRASRHEIADALRECCAAMGESVSACESCPMHAFCTVGFCAFDEVADMIEEDGNVHKKQV